MSENINLLSYRDLGARGYGSRVTIWRKVNAGEFPEPIDVGYGRKAWRESDIIDWLESKAGHVA